MENKQLAGLLLLFVGIVVVTALFNPIASNQQEMTTPYTAVNSTYSTAAAGSSVYIVGKELIGTPSEVFNESGAQIPCENNVTFSEVVRTDTGVKGIAMTSVATRSAVYCSKVNVTYVYGGDGYIDDAGGRGVAGLIVVFASLGLLAFVIYEFYKNGYLDFLNR